MLRHDAISCTTIAGPVHVFSVYVLQRSVKSDR